MSQIPAENYLRTYLYNARVLLVGGADFDPSEYEKEDHDVWVRVNNHYLEQGGRCDVLYTGGCEELDLSEAPQVVIECRPLPDELVQRDWIKFLVETLNRKYLRYDTHLYQETNPFGPEHEWLNNLHRELDTMPLTGMIAVAHLLSMPIKELELAGFDFYQRGGVLPSRRDSHGIYPQVEWLAEQCVKDKRLIVDERLGNTLQKFLSLKDLRLIEYYKGQHA